MPYGFRCVNCGFQCTNHEIGPDGGPVRISGYPRSLEECTGFKYKKEDEEMAVVAYLDHPLKDFPDYLRKRAEEIKREEWIKRGYLDGLPPIRYELPTLFWNGRWFVVIDIGG